jgi:hypothetical protein
MSTSKEIQQALIDDSVAILERELVHFMATAAKLDGYGNWEQSQCFIEKACAVSHKIGILESNCPYAPKKVLPGAGLCTIGSVGIGAWAIGSPIAGSSVGCNVLEIRNSVFSAPYGEFVIVEFVAEDVTEVITI